MKEGERLITSLYPFKCKFGTCNKRFKLKVNLSRHQKLHKSRPSQYRKSLTKCQKWVSFKKKKSHEEKCK